MAEAFLRCFFLPTVYLSERKMARGRKTLDRYPVGVYSGLDPIYRWGVFTWQTAVI
jgi:hypothetical protein